MTLLAPERAIQAIEKASGPAALHWEYRVRNASMTKSSNNGQALRIVKQVQLVTERSRFKQVINGFPIPRHDLLGINRMTAQCNAMRNPLVCQLGRLHADIAHNDVVTQIAGAPYIPQARPARKRRLLVKRDSLIKVLIDELDCFSTSAHLGMDVCGVITVRNENLVRIYPGRGEVTRPACPHTRTIQRGLSGAVDSGKDDIARPPNTNRLPTRHPAPPALAAFAEERSRKPSNRNGARPQSRQRPAPWHRMPQPEPHDMPRRAHGPEHLVGAAPIPRNYPSRQEMGARRVHRFAAEEPRTIGRPPTHLPPFVHRARRLGASCEREQHSRPAFLQFEKQSSKPPLHCGFFLLPLIISLSQ